MGNTKLPDSFLPPLAQLELCLDEAVEAAKKAAQDRIKAARRHAEAAIAEVPATLQKERRELLQRTREEAEAEAARLHAAGELESLKLRAELDAHLAGWVEELTALVLPTTDDPERS